MVDISDLPKTRNLVELLLNRADAKGDAPFLWAKHGGEWQALSWAEVTRQVCCLAESLRAMGLKDGDRVEVYQKITRKLDDDDDDED